MQYRHRSDQLVEATFQQGNTNEWTVLARYVVGCDGARSAVRRLIGHQLKGEPGRQLWGVMDILCVTNFPDIRLKCAIQSANQGSLLIIPREGGYMVRMYIQLDDLHGDERVSDRNVNVEVLIQKAQQIFAPYSIDFKEVAWWSAYEIGQRVSDHFDNRAENYEPRIFIGGDACHTHSPKAGQGMNVSMADAFNLGWKLASVIRGHSGEELLRTYSEERRAKAKELIDFDRDMARLFAKKPTSKEEVDQFQRYFQKHARYTAGVETKYDPSLVIEKSQHPELASGLEVGKRFHSAPVVRLADGKPMELGHCMIADGKWRILVFAPKGKEGIKALHSYSKFILESSISPLNITPKGLDPDFLIDHRAIIQSKPQDLEMSLIPELFLPRKGKYNLIDYEKVFCSHLVQGDDIFEKRGIDRTKGCCIVVRPDQFISAVVPISNYEILSAFFQKIFSKLVE